MRLASCPVHPAGRIAAACKTSKVCPRSISIACAQGPMVQERQGKKGAATAADDGDEGALGLLSMGAHWSEQLYSLLAGPQSNQHCMHELQGGFQEAHGPEGRGCVLLASHPSASMPRLMCRERLTSANLLASRPCRAGQV